MPDKINREYSLSALCAKFIEHKRALGCKYDSEARITGCFLKFSADFCKTSDMSKIYLTRELVEAWVARRPHEQPRTQEPRIIVVRQLAQFLRGLGIDAYSLPSRRFPIRSFKPYIFTHEQIEAIMCKADQLKPHPISPYGHKIFPVLLRMLYGTGLRISEALSLACRDVNLNDGVLTIRHAKFNKERLVPMSESLTRICSEYWKSMELMPDDPFFPSRDKEKLSTGGIYSRFRIILFDCGISHGGKGSGPRIHDFRHTFSVHSLGQWVKDGKDVYCMLPTLATYLGHSNISSTGNYLRLTAEIFPELIDAISKSCGGVIPDCSGKFEDEGGEAL
jgi:integrase